MYSLFEASMALENEKDDQKKAVKINGTKIARWNCLVVKRELVVKARTDAGSVESPTSALIRHTDTIMH